MDKAHLHPLVQILHCAVVPLTDRWNSDNYAAPYWRVYWNATPGARVILRGVSHALRPDTVLVIPPETPYAARLDAPTDHVYIHFLAQSRYRAAAPGIYAFPAVGSTLQAVKELHAGAADPGRELLLALTLAHLALSQIPTGGLSAPPADPRIQQAIRHLDEQFATAAPNPRLAAAAGMNTNAFIRLFRETTGETPQVYLRRRRIEAACVELHYAAKSIDEIASDVGFCDRFHFTKAFKQLRGIGPAAFRAMRESKP